MYLLCEQRTLSKLDYYRSNIQRMQQKDKHDMLGYNSWYHTCVDAINEIYNGTYKG